MSDSKKTGLERIADMLEDGSDYLDQFGWKATLHTLAEGAGGVLVWDRILEKPVDDIFSCLLISKRKAERQQRLYNLTNPKK